ncbi:hypothetical protein [Flavobacterium sp. CS20]|jgi:hypothetical protein|uniref:hypothetical protein n=1 Tax=Flavobacterium sp. CS20 TaxID=2775246 RepID=UPI001B3A2594|nr:hypothetical protein [Flavobacterium sp. CS20]QTY26692.1 hypothetical protein IGB25_12470 [Flavobacterium sp. CS20]
MKRIYATYLLFLFIAFLATPTVVKLIDENADVSIVYNLAEEERSENPVSSFFDFDINKQDFEALSVHETKDALVFDNYQFAIKSNHIRIPSPPPDALA